MINTQYLLYVSIITLFFIMKQTTYRRGNMLSKILLLTILFLSVLPYSIHITAKHKIALSKTSFITATSQIPNMKPLYNNTSIQRPVKFDYNWHYTSRQNQCMAKNIFFEAATQSTAGKLAVANVVMNRVKSSKWPNTICEVIEQGPRYYSDNSRQWIPKRDRCQFSWYCDGRSDVPKPGRYWRESQKVANYAISKSNNMLDITDGATHYHADYIDNPRWTYKKKNTTTIDEHIFYR